MPYDLGIIGAGPAGYVAAERAGSKGLSTVLFDKQFIGGVCLNEGCIPTKTLLHTAKLYEYAKEGKKYGLDLEGVSYDISRLMQRKNKMVKKLVGGIKSQLKNSKVEMVMEEASILEKNSDHIKIQAGDSIHECRNLLISTGSETFFPPIPGLKKENVYTNREILQIEEIPDEMTIIGGGVIGIEFADFFATMGTKVTVIEMLDEIISGMDRELAAMLRKTLAKKGVDIKLSAKVTQMNSKEITYEANGEQQTISSDHILLSAGRKPVIELPGIEKLDIEYDRNGIKIDEYCRTNTPHVYAAGDVTGYSLFAHTASREGEVAVNHMVGKKDLMRYEAVPAVVYTHPEVSGVGLTEEAAQEENIPYEVRSLPMAYAGRYVIENEGVNGLCKILVGKQYGNILGIHVLGSPSSEIIFGGAMAIEQQLTIEEFQEMVFPHPTVSEIFKETAFKK